jgi:hypothetical protein
VDSLKVPGTGQMIRRFSRTCVNSAQRNNRDARRRKVALVTVGTVRPACSLLSRRVVDEVLRFQWPPKRLGSTENELRMTLYRPLASPTATHRGRVQESLVPA